MGLRSVPNPVRIDLPDSGRRISIQWQDGKVTEASAFDLRAECPCAVCVDETTGQRLLERAGLDPEVRVTSFGRVGRYALQFRWSDGHSTGIYSYERLREKPS